MSRTAAILVSPAAGKGRAQRSAAALVRALRDHGFDARPVTGTDPKTALAATRSAVRDGVDCVVAAGGDGTAHLALQAVAGTGTALGIAALGSANDAAKELGLPVGDPAASAAVIAAWNPRALDAGLATNAAGQEFWFLNVLSSGFDAMVNERSLRMTWPRGEARYVLALIAELGSFRPVGFEIEIDGVTVADDAVFTAIGNGPRYGGGMRVCEGARFDDGQLTMTILGKMSRFELMRAFPRVYRGTHLGHPRITQYTGREFQVRVRGRSVPLAADGESVGHTPVDVAVRSGSLRMLLPPSAVLGNAAVGTEPRG